MLTATQLTSGQPYLVSGSADCATLEDRPVDGPRLEQSIARSSTEHAFWQTLPATSAEEDVARHDLVKEAKLMFELGISSPNVTSDTLRALYMTAPTDELSCGVSAQPPVRSLAPRSH